ncbi:MAG: penicillin acylase family protein [Vulcanisaeta sp.]|uniref:penicillin acylase family protein n=1 Tax=Vulcanisaeta sp. TaxID=2020871 RepID=UPI003D0F46C3
MSKNKLTYMLLIIMLIFAVIISFILNSSLSLLNPISGVWTDAAKEIPPKGVIYLPNLYDTVYVKIDKYGAYHICAANDHDLFLAFGYIQAYNRLWQMDLLSRLSSGRMSQILGESWLSYDEYQLWLGNALTANETLNYVQNNDKYAYSIFEAYTEGINDYVSQVLTTNQYSIYYKLIGYRPSYWIPLDSLYVQQYMVEGLSLTLTPLRFSALAGAMGYELANQLYPYVSPVNQTFYVPGNGSLLTLLEYEGKCLSTEFIPYIPVNEDWSPLPQQIMYSQEHWKDLLAIYMYLVSNVLPSDPGHSNAIAVQSPKSEYPLLMGGPVLPTTLPSIWFQVQLIDPNYTVYGVSIPGTPVIIIGFNKYIGWTLTDVQAQMTYFYFINATANGYYLNGAFYPYRQYIYYIPLPNGSSVRFIVNWTLLGPEIHYGDTYVIMNWTGDLPSDDIGVLLHIMQARNFTDFWNALSLWYSPPQNFVYADVYGNIAAISAGLYPLFNRGYPGMVLPAINGSLIIGYIPYYEIPQTCNPSSHYIVASNQRPIGYAYPFYIGPSWDFFSVGFRAYSQAYLLNQTNTITPGYLMYVQWNDLDYSTKYLVPSLLIAIRMYGWNNTTMRQVYYLLSSWNGWMSANSSAATIYYFFVHNYVKDVIYPWLEYYGINTSAFPVSMSSKLVAFVANLTINDPYSPWFNDPLTGERRNAYMVMVLALNQAINYLTSIAGNNISNWEWGRFHGHYLESLTSLSQFSEGPFQQGGDANTMWDSSGLNMTGGQSFTWIAIFNQSPPIAYGVFPGGESEDPLSPYYDNYVPIYEHHEYLPLIFLLNCSNPTLVLRPGPLILTIIESLAWMFYIVITLFIGSLLTYMMRFRTLQYSFLAAGISVLTQLVNWWLPFIVVLVFSIVMTLRKYRMRNNLIMGSTAMFLVIIAEYVFYLGFHLNESIKLLGILSSLVGIPAIVIAALPVLIYVFNGAVSAMLGYELASVVRRKY